jgi:hypothetical protein
LFIQSVSSSAGTADAGPFVLLRSMQPLKDAEEVAGVLHVEADAV